MAWEVVGVFLVVLIILPAVSYTAFQKRKAADADEKKVSLLASEANAPTPAIEKHASIGSLTGLNFAMDSATAVWDPNSTGMPSSHTQFQVAYTYLPFVLAHSFTDVGLFIFTIICWIMMDADNRATRLKFYGLPDAFAQEVHFPMECWT